LGKKKTRFLPFVISSRVLCRNEKKREFQIVLSDNKQTNITSYTTSVEAFQAQDNELAIDFGAGFTLQPHAFRIMEHVNHHTLLACVERIEFGGSSGAIGLGSTAQQAQQCMVVFKIEVKDVDAKDIGGKSDPFTRIMARSLNDKERKVYSALPEYKQRKDLDWRTAPEIKSSEWRKIAQTNIVYKTLTCEFDELVLTLDQVCGGDMLAALEFRVFDWDTVGEDFIGSVNCRMIDLIKHGHLQTQLTHKSGDHMANSGHIHIHAKVLATERIATKMAKQAGKRN
jgi:hypothetical protein